MSRLLSPQRICFLLLIIITLQTVGMVQSQSPPVSNPSAALIESLNPLIDIVLPRVFPIIALDVSPSLGDATLINRINFVTALGMVDAAAPYHETAVGMYTKIPRQPEAERTDLNINTAMMHAAYQTLLGLLPDRAPVWRMMMLNYGLNPDDDSLNLTDPVGIGNAAGIGALDGRMYDGMNQVGNYQDTTGYMPVNTAFVLHDPSRWQPGVRLQGTGVYSVQHFVTPQLANVEPFGSFDPRSLRVPPPLASNVENWADYKEQADAVLAVSANLTDEQKLKAELFDNKIVSLSLSYIHVAEQLGLSPADTVRGYFVKVAAALDAAIVIWQEKARYDGVRPFSAIRHIYGDELVEAWGGPGAGTISLPANQWQAYLPEADHPEYPSGSTCGCYATAQAMRRFTGTDELNWSVSYRTGSSRVEPGITPASDTRLTFETWSDFETDCGLARVWGGVHFPAAVEASVALCSTFGDLAYEYFTTLMDGTADLRAAAQELPVDPWLQASTQPTVSVIQVPSPTTPTPEACEAATDSILVTSVNSSIECQALDTGGLQQMMGYLDAVEIKGELNSGAQICFANHGSLIFLTDESATAQLIELMAYSVSGMTCGWIEQPGTVFLMANSVADHASQISISEGAELPFVSLANCQVISTDFINFRDAPAGERLNQVIPVNTNLVAEGKSSGWFNVNYLGRSGWVSSDYVQTQGTC
ncbi:MAG: hypothetical protein OXF83_05450 [Anaerolineaceae bacterium]|nr:hypothetical protein [Anaerolineaceae bacterium]